MFKVLPKRIKTTKTGVYYKSVIKTSNQKEVDKIYLIQFKDRLGKWKLKTIGKYSEGIREKDCVEQRAKLLLENKVSQNEVHADISNPYNFDYIAKKYLESVEYRLKDYHNIVSRYKNHIKPYLANKDIQEISESDLILIQRSLVDTKANKTINNILVDIGRIFSFAIKKLRIKVINPVIETPKLKISNKRERFLNVDEIQKLMESVKKDRVLLVFTSLLLTTGGRVSTVLNIKKSDINLYSNTINLYDFKNESDYLGFISKEFYSIIEKEIKYLEPSDYLIHEDDKKKVQKELQSHLDALFNQNIDPTDRKNRAVPHTLRHSFASNLAIKGVPIYTIQKLMNHRDINMTLRYAKLSPDNGKDQVWDLYS